ncbi:MAG: ABC transporter substrate-binding protein [Acidimicrobiia bacterium]|nr:ABC transporter substrate-binding protein [Actinomycetota bacterium]NDE60121.1 ABC transporter substrate-binding protein [Acidimicrobiia bacterium]
MRKARGLLVLPIVAATALAACGGDDGGSSGASGGEGSLSADCPATIVVQTDWFPEAEHGSLYQMMGADYTVDIEKKIVSGSLIDTDGKDTGVDLEIRTGGPAIGYSPVSTTMATDTSITLGYISTDDAAFNYDTIKTLAVVAPLEINPQIMMWDPETYPDVKTIADLGKAGVTLNVFAGGSFLDVFVAEGVITKDQIDASYDGSPARFISEGGKVAQQGFASAEPYQYKNEFMDWGKDVAYQLIHDAGFEIYAAPLAIRAEDKEALAPCLKKFVPIVQQAAIDYSKDGARANAIIIDAVAKYADFWVYGEGVAAFSQKTQKELGLIGNGPDKTLGNFDMDRANKVLQQMKDAGLDVPAELKAEDIYTNEFIDSNIGL